MKKLLILPLTVLLTGCVSYYYPETALEDGVYYAEDDPSYAVYSGGYAGAAYYPWSSLDYFYMGYNPYPRYGFGYGYGVYGSGFSFGISYGYSPWYYPHNYYGYYSPWYASIYHYPYYPAWRPYHGYCSHRNGCYHKNQRNHRGNGHDRYARNGHDDRRYRSGDDTDRDKYTDERRDRDYVDSYDASSVRRYVSTAPAGNSSNRGMVIRSRESTKIGKNRVHSNKSAPVQTVSPTASSTRVVQPKYSTRQSASARPPSSTSSRPPAQSKSRNHSGKSARSRSSSSSSHQESKNRDSSRHKNRR